MKISVVSTARSLEEGIAVIRPGHILERRQLRDLRLLLEELEEDGLTRLVLDFSETQHVYYRVVDLLARHSRALGRADGRMILVGMSAYLRDIFSFLGYAHGFEIADNLEEAVREAAC